MSLLKELLSKDTVSRIEIADAISKGTFTNLLLNAAPRTGKSVIASALMNKWGGKVLILSNSVNTNKQWKENIKEYNPHLLGDIELSCYQSIHKVEDKYDIIVCDEWETALSNKRYLGLMELNPKHWIAMSGSMDQWDEIEFRKLVKNDLEYVKIGIEQVVKWGIIAQPKFFRVPVEMDNRKRVLLYTKGKDKKKKNKVILYPERFKHFSDKTFNYLIQCTEKEYNEMIQNEYDFYKSKWEEDKDQIMKQVWIRKGLERKKFYASVKPRHFRTLFSQLPQGSRCLVFCNDTAQADMLNEQFSVHSNKDNKDLIERFRDKEIPYLFSVGMLNRGQDFENVDYVIILQVSGSNKENVQQIGRCFLSSKPKIILLYLRDTDDEKYVNTLLSNYPESWIKTKTL
jgi:superfamily II DNA or RNA helicase